MVIESTALNAKNPAKRWILMGIPFISLVGSIMHFVYDWSGNLAIVGIFAPINESVWEHLKMTFWPMSLWWLSWYLIGGKKNMVSTVQWFFAYSIAALICPLFIVSFYYTYTGAFGVHSLVLDISSLFLGVIIAQFLASHVYSNTTRNRYYLYCSLAVVTLLMAAFISFTFDPPHIPLFIDSSTGRYGI